MTLDLCWPHAAVSSAYKACRPLHAGLCHLPSLHMFSKSLLLAFGSPGSSTQRDDLSNNIDNSRCTGR